MREPKVVVIKAVGHFYLIKIGHKYHLVGHDQHTKKTWTVNATDKEVRVADGLTAQSIRAVSKGRAKTTADLYFYRTVKAWKESNALLEQAQ